jgi:hypothetical protein
MKLSDKFIRLKTLLAFPQILGPTLKLAHEYQNSKRENVRVFASNIGDVYVISDNKDENIVDMYLNYREEEVENEEGETNKEYSDYYFVVSSQPEFDPITKQNIFKLSIVPKDYWETEGYTYDQPLDIEEKLTQYNLESPNETSDFQAYGYADKYAIIHLLFGLGLDYNNDIARSLNAQGHNMLIRP